MAKTDNVAKRKTTLPKHEYVLHVLDKEIDTILSDQKRPGWTVWAILGGLATSSWVLLDILKKEKINFETAIVLFFLFSMLLDGISSFTTTLSIEAYPAKKTPRFLSASYLLGESRLTLSVLLIRYICFLLIALSFSKGIAWPQVAFLSLYNGLLALFLIVIIILSFLKLPISSPLIKLRPYNILINMVILGILVWSLFGYYANIIYSINVTVSEYRIAGLLIVITYLLTILTQGTQTSPILSSLIEIRRNLCFNKIDIDTAIQQIDIALVGMKLDNLIQEEIGGLLTLFDKTNSEYSEALIKTNVIESILCDKTNDQSKEQKIVVAKSLIESIGHHVKKINKFSNVLDLHFNKLTKRLKWIVFVSTDREKIISSIIDKIKSAIRNVDLNREKLMKKLSDLEQLLDTNK